MLQPKANKVIGWLHSIRGQHENKKSNGSLNSGPLSVTSRHGLCFTHYWPWKASLATFEGPSQKREREREKTFLEMSCMGADCSYLLWLMTCGLIVWKLLISFRLIKDAECKLQLDKPELFSPFPPSHNQNKLGMWKLWHPLSWKTLDKFWVRTNIIPSDSLGISSAEQEAWTAVFFCSA